jgi:hypothetical protein
MAKRPTKLHGIVILLLGTSFGLFPARAFPKASLQALSFKQALDHPPLRPQRLRVLYSGPCSVSTCRRTVAACREPVRAPGIVREAATSNALALVDFPAHGTVAHLGHPLRC